MGAFSNALGSLLVKFVGDSTSLQDSVRQAGNAIDAFKAKASSLGGAMSDLGRAMLPLSVGIGGVAAMSLKMSGQLEQNTIAFRTMMGSADAAQKHLEALKKFALETPFQFNDLVLASKRLQALGFDAQKVIPILTSVGNAAAALGIGAEGIQRITTALGQMKAKGAVQAEEMKQLAEAGIPAWQILAKTLKTDVAGAMEMVEKRTVSASVAVPAILAGMNAKFGGLMKEQSQTLLGQFSNLKDAINFTLTDIGTALTPVAKDLMASVIQPMLDKLKELAKGFAEMSPAARNSVIAIGAFLTIGPPVLATLGFMASGIGKLITLLKELGTAQVISSLATIPAMITNISFAVSNNLVGALTKGETAMLALGRALPFVAMAAGIGLLVNELLKGTEGIGAAAKKLIDAGKSDKSKGIGEIGQELLVDPSLGTIKKPATLPSVAADKIAATAEETDKLRSKVDALAQALQKLGVSESAYKLAKVLEPAWKVVAQAFEHGKVAAIDLWQATVKLGEVQFRATHPAYEMAHATNEVVLAETELQATLSKGAAELRQRALDQIEITTTAGEISPMWDKAALAAISMNESVRRAAAGLADLNAEFENNENVRVYANILKDVHDIGIRTQADLESTAERLKTLWGEMDAVGGYAYRDLLEIERKWLDAQREAIGLTVEQGKRLEELNRILDTSVKKQKDAWQDLGRTISSVFTRDLASALSGAITGAKDVADAFKKMGQDILDTILHTIIAKGIQKAIDALSNMGGLLGKIGGWLGGIGGGGGGVLGTSVGAAGGAAATIGQAAGQATAGAAAGLGGFGGSMGGLLSNVIGFAGLGVSIASGITAGIQAAHTNTKLTLIEENTRFMQIGMNGSDGLNVHMKGAHLLLKDIMEWNWNVLGFLQTHMSSVLDGMAVILSDIRRNMGSGGAGGTVNQTITINITGAADPRATAEEVATYLKRVSPAFGV